MTERNDEHTKDEEQEQAHSNEQNTEQLPSDVQQERSTGLNEQNGSWVVKYRPVLRVVFFALFGVWGLFMLWGHFHHDSHAKATTANAQNNSGNGSGQFAQNLGAGAGHTPPNSVSTASVANGKGGADKGASDAPPHHRGLKVMPMRIQAMVKVVMVVRPMLPKFALGYLRQLSIPQPVH